MLAATTSETGGKITDIGRKLLALPVHPRVGRLLLAAAEAGMVREGAAIAALLSEKDILRQRSDVHPRDRAPATQATSDLLIRLDALESRRADVEIDRNALRQVERASDELEQIARRLSPSSRYSGERVGERGERRARANVDRSREQLPVKHLI